MQKVRFEIAGDLGVITLANPPLNLFSEEIIEDLREAVTKAKKASPRALMVQVLRRRRCEDPQGKKRGRRAGAHYESSANHRGPRGTTFPDSGSSQGALYRRGSRASSRMRSDLGG